MRSNVAQEQLLENRQAKARAITFYSQGCTIDDIVQKTGLEKSALQELLDTAVKESVTAYMYMNLETPCTLIKAIGLTQKVEIINFTEDILSRAFGVNENPDWEDYEEFLEFRCMPRTRFGIREELRELGVDSYDPMLIIEKTKGRLYDDSQWLEKLEPELLAKCEAIIAVEQDAAGRNRLLGELICMAADNEEE